MSLDTRHWLGLYLRGLAMGAADLVPGVSGGTIALITGIYDRFIAAIAAVGLDALRLVFPVTLKAHGRMLTGTFCSRSLLEFCLLWSYLQHY